MKSLYLGNMVQTELATGLYNEIRKGDGLRLFPILLRRLPEQLYTSEIHHDFIKQLCKELLGE